ncbi:MULTISPECIES: hypothetical protein [Actinosynnema]|uniref:hypothetical protein n=1 Tax=Actinosynnema TaxID=40566 RepID=UPI0020A5B81A|nr:hypothetical protein [Actinosynnema pretiosum]MCP2098371.1 hypothetical protein [Actinosynnema pretiosum]
MKRLDWPRRAALALGALLVLWGIADLFGLGGGPIPSVVHAAAGLAVGLSAANRDSLRRTGIAVGLLHLVAFALGVEGTGGAFDAGPVGNSLNLVAGLGCVALAVAGAWSQRRDAAERGEDGSEEGGGLSLDNRSRRGSRHARRSLRARRVRPKSPAHL